MREMQQCETPRRRCYALCICNLYYVGRPG